MKTIAILATAVLAVSFTGCRSGNPESVSYNDIRGNLSPELKGLAMTDNEARNARAIGHTHNLRMISDDWHRLMFLDHPSRLSPFPVTYTSGQPR